MSYPKPIHWWVDNVLPLVYSEALSYMEVVGKITEYVNGLTTDMTTVKNQIEVIEAEIEQIDPERIADLLEEMDTLETLVGGFEDRIEALESAVTTDGEKISEIESDVDDLETLTGSLETSVSNFGDRLGVVEESTADFDERIATAENLAQTASSGTAAIGLRVDAVEAGLSDVEDKADNFAASVGESEEWFTATRDYVSGELVYIGDSLYKATANITSGDSLVIGTNIAATSVSDEVLRINNDIDSLANRVTTAENDIDAVEDRLDTAEDDIDAVEGRLDTAEGNITSLDSRVDTAEDDIDGLETLVEKLMADIGYTENDFIATRNYSIGELITINGDLYITLSAINTDDILTPNTNIKSTTLNEIIKDKYKIVGCVIRNTGNGFEFINDNGHEPLNCNNISTTTTGIVITFSQNFSKVVSLLCGGDEIFSKDYDVGTSVGTNSCTLIVYRKEHILGGLIRYRSGAFNTTSYATGITSGEWDSDNNCAKFYHEDISNYPAPQRWQVMVSQYSDKHRPNIKLVTSTYDEIEFYDSNGDLVTTPSASVEFLYQRSFPAGLVNPNNIVSNNGNFWIIGIMKV